MSSERAMEVAVETRDMPQLEDAATFLLRYADGDVDLARDLLAAGRMPTPCVCGERGCTGWALARLDTLLRVLAGETS